MISGKSFYFLILFALLALNCYSQNAPDLDRMLIVAKSQYPQVDSMDNIASRLHYFETHTPTAEQQDKIIQLYKSMSQVYSANVHYKQGYLAFQKYLSYKESRLAEDKQATMQQINQRFQQMDNTDNAQLSDLKEKGEALDKDVSSLNSKASVFKKIFSAAIAILSLMFAISLFRTGVRLREIKNLVQENREKLMQGHRISVLGLLAPGLKAAITLNKQKKSEAAKELMSIVPQQYPSAAELKAKLQALQN